MNNKINSLTILGRICFVLLALIALSCNKNTESEGEALRNIEINQTETKFVQDGSNFFKIVKKIKIPSQVSNEFGGSLDGFFYEDETLFAVSTYNNLIFALNDDGTIRWSVRGGSSPINNFTDAFVVKYNKFSEQIDVFDGMRLMFYSYDLNGEFVGKNRSLVNFTDRIAIDENSYIFDATQFNNSDLELDDVEYDFYMSGGNGQFKGLNPRPQLPENIVPFDDKSNFLWAEGGIYFKPNFGDTTFVYSSNSFAPFLTTSFVANNRAQGILNDPRIGAKVISIFSEDIPFTGIVVPVHNADHVVFCSRKKMHFMSRKKNSGEEFNASNMKFDGEVIPAPLTYDNGLFFSVSKEDQREALIEVSNDDELSDVEKRVKYESLSVKFRDTETLFIYVLKAI